MHQCGQYLCQKTGKAQLYYPKAQGPGRAQAGPCEAHGLEPAQVEETQASCDDFADDRGDPRTDDAHMQAEDKNRIEDDIDGGAGHHAFHRVFRRTVGPNHGGKGGADELKGKSDGDSPEIGEGFVVGRVRGAEKPHDPRREQGADDGHDEAAHDDPSDPVAEDAIRRVLIFSPQAQADVGGAAVAEHEGDGVHEDGDGKGHVYRGHAGDSRPPAHKDLIDDVIEVIDHEGQGRRHRVADKELRDRLRRQGAVDGLHLFHHAPSFFAFRSRGSAPQIKTSGDKAPKGIACTGCFFSEDEGKGHPATSRKASFSLPDYTVGFGFAPNQLCARGLLPPVEYIRFRRKLSPLIYHHFMAWSMISCNFLFFRALIRQNHLKCSV